MPDDPLKQALLKVGVDLFRDEIKLYNIEQLHKMMEISISYELYEQAAIIRDELKSR